MALDLIRDRVEVRNGDVVNFSVEVSNPNFTNDACDVSNVTITLQPPAPNGQPSSTSQTVTTNAQYPAAAPGTRGNVSQFGPFPYTVAADPGVTRLLAQTSIVNGILHATATGSPFSFSKTIDLLMVRPAITIAKTGSITGPLPAPQSVTYTYTVRNNSTPNDGSVSADATAISNVTVSDDLCPHPSAPTPNPGDTNKNNKLDLTEAWTFTCTTTHGQPGTFVDTAVANGQSILNNRTVPVVSPPAQWTVVLTAPPAPPTTPGAPPPPQGGVLPATQTQAPCTLRTARSLRVRAGQLNTIQVTVRRNQPLANKIVRIKLPGASRTISARTNAKGVATFRVRPAHSGRATITAGACTTARISVKPARQVVSPAVPRVTG